jgi:hypothetical protein
MREDFKHSTEFVLLGPTDTDFYAAYFPAEDRIGEVYFSGRRFYPSHQDPHPDFYSPWGWQGHPLTVVSAT